MSSLEEKQANRLTRSGRVILGATAASVALLLGAWVLLRPDAPAPQAPAATPAGFAGGVEAAAVDWPRPSLDDDPGPARLAMAALPANATVEDRLRVSANLPPPPPPDPALMAAQDAFAAAFPVATAELEDEIASRRSALRRACWKTGGPDSATFFITTSFGADGKLSEHSVTDDGASPGVSDCMHAQLTSLKVRPPGVALTTRAKLELP